MKIKDGGYNVNCISEFIIAK
jgi:hypothetical protein